MALDHRKNNKRIQVQRELAKEFKWRKKTTKRNSIPGKCSTKRLGDYWGNQQ